MKFARMAALGVIAACAAAHAEAPPRGDFEAGRIKASTCMGCHGIPAYNNVYPTYRVPKLGGQQVGYIEAALKSYRSGERPHGTMHAQAANLSDADIADVAAYLSHAPAHR
jgi:cytochrome c553